MRAEKAKQAEIRSNFAKGASDYDAWIRKVIPDYDEMLDVTASFAARNGRAIRRAIDIGCGTGALSVKLIESHPGMELTCMDMTESMLDCAKNRMEGRANVRYVLADLYDFEFDGPYDLVVSSLALHHVVTDEDKRTIYQRILDALGPGGSFFNADLVLGSDDSMQRACMERWIEFLSRSFPRQEVDRIVQRYYTDDSPARLVDHLRWMDEVGFRGVDVIWKRYNYAVWTGRK